LIGLVDLGSLLLDPRLCQKVVDQFCVRV